MLLLASQKLFFELVKNISDLNTLYRDLTVIKAQLEEPTPVLL